MSRKNQIPSIVSQIFIFLVLLLTNVLTEKYEHTTKCVYTFVEGVQSFEFICEPNKITKEYFTNGNPIYCDSRTGHAFYKDRRHEIRFRDCELKQLPVIFQWYKAVRLLNVSSLGLESLRSENFKYANNLVTLIASYNQITELPSSLFDGAKNLRVVDLSYNKINQIDPLAFNTSNNVTLLNLSNNLLFRIDNRTFAELSQLEELNLSFNLLTDIPEGLFGALTKLRHLNLGNNLLKQLKCSVFSNLPKLKFLDATRNKLQVFDSNCVQSESSFVLILEGNELEQLNVSKNVSEINASANMIGTISISGNDSENMTVFNVSRNNVENILEVMHHLSRNIIILDVADSFIGKLNISTFESFDNLEYLSLRNTNLSNIQYGTFHHQQKLRYLDLSGNDLKKINFGMLHWNSMQLERLYLDGNQLDDLSNLTKANYPSLDYVSIDNNSFDCDYLSEVQQRWKKEGISVVRNPHIVSTVQNTNSHVNGVTCYHDSIASMLPVDNGETDESKELNNGESDGSKEVNSEESYVTKTKIASYTNPISLRKVEFLLVCIVIVLVFLLLVTIIMNFVPMFKRMNSVREYGSEPVYYSAKIDEVPLISS